MKIYNIHKLIVVFFISTLFLTSCNNESDTPIAENAFDGNGLKVLTYAYHEKGVSGKGLSVTTIAEFDTQDTYNNYADDLDNQMDALDDAFVAEWGYLDDDALNAKEEELGFDSEKPLTDFENQIGLQSLRQKYIVAENTWLDNDILDEATDPDNSSIYDFDESKMALINKLGEVKIGATIIKKLTVKQINDINTTLAKSGVKGKAALVPIDGAYLTINDGDFNTLIAYNEGDVSVVNNGNVTVESGASAIDCKYNKKKVQSFNLSTTRKIKAKIKVGQPTFGTGNVKAKIISYKKRNSRGWKRYRTTLTVGLVGDVSDGNCSGYTEHIDKNRPPKRRRRYKYKYHNPNFQTSHVVENGGMKGVYSQNGVTRELVLTW